MEANVRPPGLDVGTGPLPTSLIEGKYQHAKVANATNFVQQPEGTENCTAGIVVHSREVQSSMSKGAVDRQKSKSIKVRAPGLDLRPGLLESQSIRGKVADAKVASPTIAVSQPDATERWTDFSAVQRREARSSTSVESGREHQKAIGVRAPGLEPGTS